MNSLILAQSTYSMFLDDPKAGFGKGSTPDELGLQEERIAFNMVFKQSTNSSNTWLNITQSTNLQVFSENINVVYSKPT